MNRANEIFDVSKTVTVSATALDTDWQVRLTIGRQETGGEFISYLTTTDARKIAAALTKAADHYDAESARLAQVAA